MASIVGRRWGPAVGGWLVGLPFSSARIAFFLARDEGLGFATTAAAGTMVGTITQVGFCLAYGWAARPASWQAALAAGGAAFALCTLLLDAAPDLGLLALRPSRSRRSSRRCG